MKIFFGTSIPVDIRDQFSKYLQTSSNLKIERFKDEEILPTFDESVRGEEVFIIQSMYNSDLIMETLLIVDAAKRAGCNSITLVAPYLPYSRQDRIDKHRSSIGSKLISDMLEAAGIHRLVTIDLHAAAIQGFYNIPVIHLNGSRIFTWYIKSLKLDNLCILSPDQGAVKRASDFCKAFPDASFAMINKKRVKPNEIHSMELVGDVTGKNVIIVDDLSDTGGTLKKAAELVMENNAKSVYALCSHGVLSDGYSKNLTDSPLLEMIVSDSVPTALDKVKENDKLKVISCVKLLANTIEAISQKKSVSETINSI